MGGSIMGLPIFKNIGLSKLKVVEVLRLIIKNKTIDGGKGFDWGKVGWHRYFGRANSAGKKVILRNEYQLLCGGNGKHRFPSRIF